jgi:hypothetical protein
VAADEPASPTTAATNLNSVLYQAEAWMNAARMLKLVIAGFIAAALLVAVPAESQALTPGRTRSSVGSSSTDATDGVMAMRSVGMGRAQDAASLPAVTRGEVKAVRAMLPKCGCPPNAGEVEYALKELGVKSLSQKLLDARLGTQVGDTAFSALVDSLSKKAAKLGKMIPFPDYKSKTASSYAKSPYRVYEIYGTSVGPGFYYGTWKYGHYPPDDPGATTPTTGKKLHQVLRAEVPPRRQLHL